MLITFKTCNVDYHITKAENWNVVSPSKQSLKRIFVFKYSETCFNSTRITKNYNQKKVDTNLDVDKTLNQRKVDTNLQVDQALEITINYQLMSLKELPL